MAVIDCDVVQMPHGEWEMEMNVTDWPACKLLFSQGERWMRTTAGARQLSLPLLTWLDSGTDLHVQHKQMKVARENHSAFSDLRLNGSSSYTLLPLWPHTLSPLDLKLISHIT